MEYYPNKSEPSFNFEGPEVHRPKTTFSGEELKTPLNLEGPFTHDHITRKYSPDSRIKPFVVEGPYIHRNENY